MAGYRPDDEWALTDESGNRIDGGWKVILAFVGLFIALVLIGELGHVPLVVLVGIAISVGTPCCAFGR